MLIPLRQTATSLFIATAACAVPAFAQNAAPAAPAPAATTSYGTTAPAPADRRAAHRTSEADLLGAPNPYDAADGPQGNTVDTQQAALLDEQRMRVTAGGPNALTAAQGKGNKAPAAANAQAQARVAGQPARTNAADGLMPANAAKTTYADPYDTTGAGKHAVYRSPW